METNGEIILNPNSYEAINFAIFQEQLLNSGDIISPILDYSQLIDLDTLTNSLDTLTNSGLISEPEKYLNILKDILDTII